MSEPWFGKDVDPSELPEIVEWGKKLDLVIKLNPLHEYMDYLDYGTWTMARMARIAGEVDFCIPVDHPRRRRCALGFPDQGNEFVVATVMSYTTFRTLCHDLKLRPEFPGTVLHVSWHSGLPDPPGKQI